VSERQERRETLAHRLLAGVARSAIRLLCRVDDDQLAILPETGPLVFVVNHINFLEVPLLYTHLLPRPVTGFAKVEAWSNPFLRYVFTLGGAIPVNRGEGDVGAMRRALAALEEDCLVAVAPEGTRSGHGRLQRARSGAVLLALRTGAPVWPVAHYGGEDIWRNLARLRRTFFHVVVGQPFHLEANGAEVTRRVRQEMVDEVMYQVAALLPPPYRGVYADLDAATERYLRFLPGAESNLLRAGASESEGD
jgi:1-acyl-sn-glycerol-3-phosphate acyltransferase